MTIRSCLSVELVDNSIGVIGYSVTTDLTSLRLQYNIIMLLCFRPIEIVDDCRTFCRYLFIFFQIFTNHCILALSYRTLCVCVYTVFRSDKNRRHNPTRSYVSNTTDVRGGDGMIKYTRFPRSPSASFTTHFIQYV